jgi:hypothetical protein
MVERLDPRLILDAPLALASDKLLCLTLRLTNCWNLR